MLAPRITSRSNGASLPEVAVALIRRFLPQSSTNSEPDTRAMGMGVVNVATSRADLVADADDDETGECGWLCLRPEKLQKTRTAKWVLFWLCWAAAAQGTFFSRKHVKFSIYSREEFLKISFSFFQQRYCIFDRHFIYKIFHYIISYFIYKIKYYRVSSRHGGQRFCKRVYHNYRKEIRSSVYRHR